MQLIERERDSQCSKRSAKKSQKEKVKNISCSFRRNYALFERVGEALSFLPIISSYSIRTLSKKLHIIYMHMFGALLLCITDIKGDVVVVVLRGLALRRGSSLVTGHNTTTIQQQPR